MEPRPVESPPAAADDAVDSSLIDDARILVVDDDEFISAMAQAYLEHAGFSRIETATDGQTCLDRLHAHPPDIVILDLQMPVVGGLDVLRRMRETPALADVPVLVTTGIDESQERNEAIRAGANSLISKPFDAPLLIEKTRSLIERQILVQQLNLYRERVSRELEMAKELQLALLPSDEMIAYVRERYGCRVSSRFRSSSELAGDFWGLQPLNDSQLAVYSVDISGHGVAAAANTFRLHEIIQSEDMHALPPADFLARVNQRFHARIPAGQFATILYGVIDVAADSFTYASAAAPPPIIGRPGAGAPRYLENRGILAGATSRARFSTYQATLRTGDYLFLYSDALPEASTPTGELLGDDAPARFLTDALARDADDPLPTLMDTFYARTTATPQDDLTLIYVRRGPQETGG
jgi:sigma-B regulation protein RsbU (phosphoserine phosphatase)